MVNTVIDYRNKNNVTQNDFLQTILNTRDKELEAKPNDRDAQGLYNYCMIICSPIRPFIQNSKQKKKGAPDTSKLNQITKTCNCLLYTSRCV